MPSYHTTPLLISPQSVPGRLCLQGKLYDPHCTHTHTHIYTTTRRLTSAQRERVPMLSPCSNLPHTAPSCYLSITLSRLPSLPPLLTTMRARTHASCVTQIQFFFYARIFFSCLVLLNKFKLELNIKINYTYMYTCVCLCIHKWRKSLLRNMWATLQQKYIFSYWHIVRVCVCLSISLYYCMYVCVCSRFLVFRY